MCQLIESIRIENCQLHHIELHNKRFNVAARVLFGIKKNINLEDIIDIPANLENSRYKCRITFDGKKASVNISPYHQREIKTLTLVEMNNIDYTYKTTNRELLDKAFQLRAGADDVLIIKDGFITDSWAANAILWDGSSWFTPSTPLLKGIQREFLLNNGKIKEAEITAKNIRNFQKIKLINAMIDFERSTPFDIINVK